MFVDYILPDKQPDLTVFWSKEPDATSHAYRRRTHNFDKDATRMNDEILGRVMDKLRQLGWEQSTDIIITQDHNHSTVSGDIERFPLRNIADGGAGAPDPHGYSVSGFVRTAELLTRDGLKAYDGAGCRAVPILSGILPDGTHLQPLRHDEDGSVCRKPQQFTSSAFVLPKRVPAGSGRRGCQRRQRLPVRSGRQPRRGEGRCRQPAKSPAIRRRFRELSLRRDRWHAAYGSLSIPNRR